MRNPYGLLQLQSGKVAVVVFTNNILFIRRTLYIGIFISAVSCQSFQKSTPGMERPAIAAAGNETNTNSTSHGDVAHVPDFVTVKAPRVGLIFGPGGAKALAHIGALQEIERQKIPIVAATGMEWGALVGALYSLNGQSHEVDWKISQLPKINFSGSNLFSKKLQATKIAEYTSYLNKVFASARLESVKLPFACSYLKNQTATTGLMSKGAIQAGIKNCLQYPPVFSASTSQAAPYAISDAVAYLRKQGAELILLINVLENPSQKDFINWEEPAWLWMSWAPVYVALKDARSAGVHETITLDTSAFSMTDFDQRLRLIQVGKQSSAAQIDQLIKKYDF